MKQTRVRIKFCGMTRAEDIAAAALLGVDAIGLIFSDKSKRCVSIEQAKKILLNVPPLLTVVAVFVNPPADYVEDVIRELPISCLQFHGDELASFCEQFNIPYVKAVAAKSQEIINTAYSKYQTASAILADTPVVGEYGGTGQVFDWELAPKKQRKPFILAGGLDSTNIGSAISSCSPYAVDVCSGVEQSLGIKDFKKMQQLIEAVNKENYERN